MPRTSWRTRGCAPLTLHRGGFARTLDRGEEVGRSSPTWRLCAGLDGGDVATEPGPGLVALCPLLADMME